MCFKMYRSGTQETIDAVKIVWTQNVIKSSHFLYCHIKWLEKKKPSSAGQGDKFLSWSLRTPVLGY